MTIANRVSILLVAAFAVVAPLTGMAWDLYAWHWIAFALVLVVTFGLFALGGMGGGDAKLISATALWMGFGLPLAEYLLTASILGGMLTLLLMSLRGSPVAGLVGSNRIVSHFADPKVGVPYGVALGAAGLLIGPDSSLMVWAMERLVQ